MFQSLMEFGILKSRSSGLWHHVVLW